MNALDVGPFPFIKGTSSGDKDVTHVFDDFITAQLLDLHMPFRCFFVPAGLDDFVVEFHESPDIILVRNLLPVLENLWRSGIELGPFHRRLESQLIRVGRDICVIVRIAESLINLHIDTYHKRNRGI